MYMYILSNPVLIMPVAMLYAPTKNWNTLFFHSCTDNNIDKSNFYTCLMLVHNNYMHFKKNSS